MVTIEDVADILDIDPRENQVDAQTAGRGAAPHGSLRSIHLRTGPITGRSCQPRPITAARI